MCVCAMYVCRNPTTDSRQVYMTRHYNGPNNAFYTLREDSPRLVFIYAAENIYYSFIITRRFGFIAALVVDVVTRLHAVYHSIVGIRGPTYVGSVPHAYIIFIGDGRYFGTLYAPHTSRRVRVLSLCLFSRDRDRPGFLCTRERFRFTTTTRTTHARAHLLL